MLEVHGVLHLVVEKPGIDVTYQYAEVSKFIPIHTIRSGVKQISEDSLELIKSRYIFSYNNIKTFHWHFQNDDPFNDNISVAFGGPHIPIETYFDPFLADLLINWYQVDFMHGLLQSRQNNLIKSFNSSFCYVNDTYTLYLVKLWWFIENKRNCLDKRLLLTNKLITLGLMTVILKWPFGNV